MKDTDPLGLLDRAISIAGSQLLIAFVILVPIILWKKLTDPRGRRGGSSDGPNTGGWGSPSGGLGGSDFSDGGGCD